MKKTAAVCLAAGGAKPPKSDTASVGNHRSDDVARFLRLPLIESPELWKALHNKGYVLKTDDIHPPKTGISVHFLCSLP